MGMEPSRHERSEAARSVVTSRLRWLGGRLSYANVVSTIALFAAIGTGGAYAATKLGANSVGTSQLRDHAVTTAKLGRGVAVSGPQGALGQPGPVGVKGDVGEQ